MFNIIKGKIWCDNGCKDLYAACFPARSKRCYRPDSIKYGSLTCPKCNKKEFYCNQSGICIKRYHHYHKSICNRKNDCPLGEDEMGCNYELTCSGGIKCEEQEKCVAYENLCDGNLDCDHSTDEMKCDLYIEYIKNDHDLSVLCNDRKMIVSEADINERSYKIYCFDGSDRLRCKGTLLAIL